MRTLILPGIGNSGPEHWQSHWEKQHDDFARVEQKDWEHPVCRDWVGTLERAVRSSEEPTILVAHSLGCLLVAHWATRTTTTVPVRGALLVGVPDPAGPVFPAEAQGFSDIPRYPLPFRSIMVASNNDPYATMEYSRRMATVWKSELIPIGDAGHINADSGFGEWLQGQEILNGII